MTADMKQATKIQRLSQGDLKPLSTIMDQVALTSHFPGDAVLNGADPVIRSPHHLAEAQLLIGIAGAAIWYARTGQQTDISIDIIDALHFLHPTHFIHQQDPMVLAATVVYASCIGTSEQKSQIDVANAAEVTDVTNRNRFKDLKNRLGLPPCHN